jgi:undecaprenyl-diphosphatase
MNKLLKLDQDAFNWLHGLVGRSILLDDFWKVSAVYLVYMVPVFLLVNWFVNVKTREASIRGTVIGAFGWLVLTPLISHIWYRPRPFVAAGVNAKELVFHRPDYSFPSDHAVFAFSVASGFYFAGYKKLGIALYVVAILISFSRVVAGVHYPLDVIAGGIIGILLTWLAWHFRGQFDRVITNPIMWLMKTIHLA